MEHLKKVWWIFPTLLAGAGFILNLYIEFEMMKKDLDIIQKESKEFRSFKKIMEIDKIKRDMYFKYKFGVEYKKKVSTQASEIKIDKEIK